MSRAIYNMNRGWKFYDGEIELRNHKTVHSHFKRPEWAKAANNGLAHASYNDSTWQNVDLPHDFVIERGIYDATTPSCTGSLKKGVVWYRKTFTVPKEDEGRRLFIRFEGVYRNSDVWLNGCLLGKHLGGYMGFEYEVTEVIKYGTENTFAVHIDANEYEGWWYEGGGIYRDVYLIKTDKTRVLAEELHIKQEAVCIKEKTADLMIEGAIDSNFYDEGVCEVALMVKNDQNEVVTVGQTQIESQKFEKTFFAVPMHLENVNVWDLEERHLYTLEVAIKTAKSEESYSQKFGVRTIAYSVERGFELNGKTVKLKGVCGHDDFAGVGTALTRPIMAFKIQKLMEMGCNAYRCSHNPPHPKFLELCDEMGMLVLDETRMPGVDDENLGDYVAMIKRDRNHPSVICWSMGNEEMALQQTEIGVRIIQKMQHIGLKYDQSRPFLYALNNDYSSIIDWDREHHLICNPVGVNYFSEANGDNVYHSIHERYPDLVMINTETTGICTSRAYCLPEDDRYLMSPTSPRITAWDDPDYKEKVTCYGSSRPVWGARPDVAWQYHVDKTYSAGMFLWTGFDYRGEVFPFDYPATISFFGIIDLCGFEKDWFYYMQSQWTTKPVLHLLPHWNMNVEEGTVVKVWAFTNAEEVELFLNNKSYGKQVCENHGFIEWQVPYEKGTLKAIGYEKGVQISEDKKVTAGQPVKLVLEVNKKVIKADDEDAVIISAHLEDAEGNLVMTSGERIVFSSEGPCEFKGTGNGDNLSSEHDKLEERKLFVGRCLAIYKGTYEAGEITVRGLWKDQLATVSIKSEATPYMPTIEASTFKGEEDNRQKSKADGGF